MIRPRLARQRVGGASAQSPLDTEPFVANLRRAELVRTASCDDDEVDSSGQEVVPGAEALSAHALDPVPAHGRADFTADDEAQPDGGRRAEAIWLPRHEEREMLGSNPPARPLRVDELHMATQAAALPEGEGRRGRHGSARGGYFL